MGEKWIGTRREGDYLVVETDENKYRIKELEVLVARFEAVLDCVERLYVESGLKDIVEEKGLLVEGEVNVGRMLNYVSAIGEGDLLWARNKVQEFRKGLDLGGDVVVVGASDVDSLLADFEHAYSFFDYVVEMEVKEELPRYVEEGIASSRAIRELMREALGLPDDLSVAHL